MMWSLFLVLFSVGVVCCNHSEYLIQQKILKGRFKVTPAPDPIPSDWVLATITSVSHSSSLHAIVALCGKQALLVVAKLDLFGNGHLIQAVDLTLGPLGCPFTHVDTWMNIVLFYYHLSDCGTNLVMVTEHHLLYSTHLYYMLKEPRLAIVRTSLDIALIECHYPRKDDVNSQAVWPTWLPFKSLSNGGGFLSYSLRQMNDKWDAERVSNVYYLGELIHIEASVMTIGHEPLRLYVDNCVATLTPDKDSTPRYQLIDFSGAHQNTLQINLGAFRFLNGRSLVFITCNLKVTEIGSVPDPANKACFFQKPENEWISVEGSNEICQCCDHGNCRGSRGNVGFQQRTAVFQSQDDQLRKGEIQMGPLVILASESADFAPRMQTENQNISNGQGTPEHNGVDLKIVVGVVGAVALMLSGLVVGGIIICGSLTIFNLYNKLIKPSI
ncbi:zona pellucida sperm-binding protein 3-like isoform X2 [Rhincodon typus]|uniref:zona pellucida sperm-binding protein 3-like isoform X2 n=1 Tax=Rhincodon typus TaxID=259920 RepID=UPI00202E7A62|nr:zona pellucida sperm-binding protein 3-like isoform X2 [Rhincodon typus]